MALIELIKQRYLTWRTGKTQHERAWDEWYEVNVNYRAHDISDMFKNFRHVIEVDADKFLWDDGLAWVPPLDAQQYFWPNRPLGKNCVWRIERVSWNEWAQRWYLDGMGGEDLVFVAANSDEDALMIALKYS